MAFRLYWPTTTPHITQPFGVNWTGVPDFYTRFGLPGHEGLDFEAGDGAEIHAAADGVVSRISLDGDTDPNISPMAIKFESPTTQTKVSSKRSMRIFKR